jgi:hypothetical protein
MGPHPSHPTGPHLSYRYVVPFLDQFMPTQILYSGAINARVLAHEAVSDHEAAEIARQSPPKSAWGRGAHPRRVFGAAMAQRKEPTEPTPVPATLPPAASRPILRASDTFFWAVAAGSWDLAHTLWSSTDDPLRSALIAYGMCKRMALKSEEHADDLLRVAAGFETRAINITSALPPDIATDSTDGLLLQLRGSDYVGGDKDLIMVAWAVEAKRFMTLPNVKKVLHNLEHSSHNLALPEHFTWWHILCTCSFPTMLPVPNMLAVCTDLEDIRWRKEKRKLSLGSQRRQTPQTRNCMEKYADFLRIPRVKISLRGFWCTQHPLDSTRPLDSRERPPLL